MNNRKYQLLVRDTLQFINQNMSKESLVVDSSSEEFFRPKPKQRSQTQPNAIPPTNQASKSNLAPNLTPNPLSKFEEPPQKKEVLPITKKVVAEPFTEKIRVLIEKKAPHIKLIHSIPSDQIAKERAALWKKNLSVILLAFSQNTQDLLFLKNLANAIQTSFSISPKIINAGKITNENQWQAFFEKHERQLIIGFKHSLDRITDGISLPSKLNLIPLLTPYEYEKHPSLKRELWKMLKQILQS